MDNKIEVLIRKKIIAILIAIVLLISGVLFLTIQQKEPGLLLPKSETILDNETPLSKGYEADKEMEASVVEFATELEENEDIETLTNSIVPGSDALIKVSNPNNNTNNSINRPAIMPPNINDNNNSNAGNNNNNNNSDTNGKDDDNNNGEDIKLITCPICSNEYLNDLDECPNCHGEYEITCPLCKHIYFDKDKEAECPECHGIHPDLIIKDDAPEDALRSDLRFNVYDQNYENVNNIDYILKRDNNTVGVANASYGTVLFENQAILEDSTYTLRTLDREPCAEFNVEIKQNEYSPDDYTITLNMKKNAVEYVDSGIVLTPTETIESIYIYSGSTSWHSIYIWDDYKDNLPCDHCDYVYRHMKYDSCPICNNEGLKFNPDIIAKISDDEKTLPYSYRIIATDEQGNEEVYYSKWDKDASQSLKLDVPFKYNQKKTFTFISDAIPYYPVTFTITLNNKSSWDIQDLNYDSSINGDWQVNGYYWNSNITFERNANQQYSVDDVTECVKCGEETFGYHNSSSEPYCSDCGWCLDSVTLFCTTCNEYHHLCMSDHSNHIGYTELMDSKECANHSITNSGKDTTSYEFAEQWCDKHSEEHGYWYYLTENEKYQKFPGNSFGIACVECLKESLDKGTFSGYHFCTSEDCYHQYDMLLYANCPWCGESRDLALPFENENVDSWYIVKDPNKEVYASFNLEMHDEYYPRTYKSYEIALDDRWALIDDEGKICALSDWGSNSFNQGVIGIGKEYTVMQLSDFVNGNMDTPVQAKLTGITSEILGTGECYVCKHSQSGNSGIGQWTQPLQHTVALWQQYEWSTPSKIGCENANLNPEGNSYWYRTVQLDFEWGDCVTCGVCGYYDHASEFEISCPKCGGINEYQFDGATIKSVVNEVRSSESSDYWYTPNNYGSYYQSNVGIKFEDCSISLGSYNYETGEEPQKYQFEKEIEEVDSLNRIVTYTAEIPAQVLTYAQMMHTDLRLEGTAYCASEYIYSFDNWYLFADIQRGVLNSYDITTPYIYSYGGISLNLHQTKEDNVYNLSADIYYDGGMTGPTTQYVYWNCPVCLKSNTSSYTDYGSMGGMDSEYEKAMAMRCYNCDYWKYYEYNKMYSHCDDCGKDYKNGNCIYCDIRNKDWDCPLCSNHITNYTSGYYNKNIETVCPTCSYDKKHSYQQCPVCNNKYYYYDSSSNKYVCLYCKRFGLSAFSLTNDNCDHCEEQEQTNELILE